MDLSLLVLTIVLASAAIVWWRGGQPERFAALIIVGWIASDSVYHLLFGKSDFVRVDPVHVVLDTAELIGIVWLALRANRVWPLFAAAAQVMCVSGHIAVLASANGFNQAYWAITSLPQYIQLFAVLAGAAAHTRRVRLIGPYRSWRYSPG